MAEAGWGSLERSTVAGRSRLGLASHFLEDDKSSSSVESRCEVTEDFSAEVGVVAEEMVVRWALRSAKTFCGEPAAEGVLGEAALSGTLVVLLGGRGGGVFGAALAVFCTGALLRAAFASP